VVLDAAGAGAAEWWDAATIVQRRELVRELLTVTVLPAAPGRRVFDPTFVRVERRVNLAGGV
jgi:hypothetical protein